MPHHNFGKMDEKDIHAMIVYIRSLEPIEKTNQASSSDFPMDFIINTIPAPAHLQPMPNKQDQVAYGQYLVTAASCYDCHTKQEKGQFVGEDFAGGFEFPLRDGSIVRSPNITPHETGIGGWTKEQFVHRFKSYADSSYVPATVAPGALQTVMPWTMYGGMESEDLEAIFAYLQTLSPIDNTVEKFTPPPTE